MLWPNIYLTSLDPSYLNQQNLAENKLDQLHSLTHHTMSQYLNCASNFIRYLPNYSQPDKISVRQIKPYQAKPSHSIQPVRKDCMKALGLQGANFQIISPSFLCAYYTYPHIWAAVQGWIYFPECRNLLYICNIIQISFELSMTVLLFFFFLDFLLHSKCTRKH